MRAPRIFVFSHELSNTGAPLVLVDVLKQWYDRGDMPLDSMVFFTPYSERNSIDVINELESINITFKNLDSLARRFKQGDIVFLNTIAYPNYLFERILMAANSGDVEHVFIYSHEHELAKMMDPASVELLSEALSSGHATLYASSKKSLSAFISTIGSSKGIILMPNRFDIRAEEFQAIESSRFDTIAFVMAGTTDIRKGQLDAVYAFLAFYYFYYLGNEEQYRNFSLTIIGASDANLPAIFYVERIKHAALRLGDRIRLLDYSTMESFIEVIKESNISILYSLFECLPRSIFDGMAYGHPIIRNDCGGIDEQLVAGVNGWEVSLDDWQGFVDTIESVLNKEKTTNEELAAMSKASVDIARQFEKVEYRVIDDILLTYTGSK